MMKFETSILLWFETELRGGQIKVAAACQQLITCCLSATYREISLTNEDLGVVSAACKQNEDSQSALSYSSP